MATDADQRCVLALRPTPGHAEVARRYARGHAGHQTAATTSARRPGRPSRPRRRGSAEPHDPGSSSSATSSGRGLAPAESFALGTDVAGRISSSRAGLLQRPRAGWPGSGRAAASSRRSDGTAAGRALVKALESDKRDDTRRSGRGARTGRIGVVVAPGGERSLRDGSRGGAPSRTRRPQGRLVRRRRPVAPPGVLAAGRAARGVGCQSHRARTRRRMPPMSLDLASIGPLIAGVVGPPGTSSRGSRRTSCSRRRRRRTPWSAGRRVRAARVRVGGRREARSKGATVLARRSGAGSFEVATARLAATDTTGAGDAFDAGFLAAWLGSPPASRSLPASLHRAALAGHRAAGRQLSTPRPELPLG